MQIANRERVADVSAGEVSVCDGIRLCRNEGGMKMAIIGVSVGEFITAQARLGYIIMFASFAGETATVLAAIVLLCCIGLTLSASSWSANGLCSGGMPVRCRSGVSYDGSCRRRASRDAQVAQADPKFSAASSA